MSAGDLDLRLHVRRGQDRRGGVRLRGERHVTVAAGHRAHIRQRLTGDVQQRGDLLAGLLRPAGHQAVDQLALERDRGEAVAQQVVQVPREAQPLLRDGQPGEFGARAVHLLDEVGEPGQSVDHQAREERRQHQIGRLQPAERHHQLEGGGDRDGRRERDPRPRERHQKQNRSRQRTGHADPGAVEDQDRCVGEDRLGQQHQDPGPRRPALGPCGGVQELQEEHGQHDGHRRGQRRRIGAVLQGVERDHDRQAQQHHDGDGPGEPRRGKIAVGQPRGPSRTLR